MADSTEISVSTTFFPSALLPNVPAGTRSDLIVHTSDTVFFYVHQSVLQTRSNNNFGLILSNPYYIFHQGQLAQHTAIDPESSTGHDVGRGITGSPPPSSRLSPKEDPSAIPTIFVSEDSVVFNVILHIVYDMPCGRYGPTIEVISSTLEALPRYGLPSPDPTNEIWSVLLKQVEVHPLRVYALGAAHAVHSVCVQSSEHTLNTPLSNLTEADTITMGAIYLRRLLFLHLGRTEAFKRILGSPPETHPDTVACCEATQRIVKKAWKAVLCDLLLNEMPQATPVSSLISAFGPIANSTQCLLCKERIQERIASVVDGWRNVKSVI